MSDWWLEPAQTVDKEAATQARQRQSQLTKPAGSLGRLEALAIQFAGLQRSPLPVIDKISIRVFAADHGIANAGVSAYPQAVTREMVRNFANGGAAINVLARSLDADLQVIDVGTATDPGELAAVVSRRIAAGTASFIDQPAMQASQLSQALAHGKQAAVSAHHSGCQLLIGGEMGIGNTTSAAALACALLNRPAQELVGPGTGLDSDGIKLKIEIVERALDHHRLTTDNPLGILRCLGGFEIAALSGCYLSAAQMGIPVLVDGFIAGVAALIAVKLNATIGPWLLYAHRSAEPGHSLVLNALHAKPLLDLDLRLGEGSGAALAVPLMRQALSLHRDMATFAQAGVSGPEL